MMVEEARIIAEYTVITGRIKEGKIGSRDDLTIIKSNGERIQAAAVWIKSNGSFQKHAEIGDRVEICLKNALKLSRGDIAVKSEGV